MRGKGLALAGLVGACLAGGAAEAAGTIDALSESLAPALLRSRAATRILQHDDTLALACHERSFAGAVIVPASLAAEAGHRKWQEQWLLDRCGSRIAYRVFFTDLGDAGAYFAFKQVD